MHAALQKKRRLVKAPDWRPPPTGRIVKKEDRAVLDYSGYRAPARPAQ